MQLEKEANWKDPLAYAVTATILYRTTEKPSSLLSQFEFLVTTRQRGAAKGHHQTHHGGFIKPTDQDVMAAALRELREETGFALHRTDLHFLALMGPELYRSTMRYEGNDMDGHLITMTIGDQQAEPLAPFILSLFIADVSNATYESKDDDEVNDPRWLTLGQIIDQYGQSMQFNYFSMLFQAIRWLVGTTILPFPDPSPGDWQLGPIRFSE